MDWHKPVSELRLVGPGYTKRLTRLGIQTIGDLLYHFPHRYLDYSLVSPIAKVQAGEIITVKGKITSSRNLYTRYHKNIQQLQVRDATGSLEVVWFNQPYLIKSLKPGLMINLSGKADWFGKKIVLVSPEYEVDRGLNELHTGRLVPIYHETSGLSSKWLRARTAPLLKNNFLDFLPPAILSKYNLPDINTALAQIHFPTNQKQATEARKRFAFEELFLIQLTAQVRKKNWQRKKTGFKISLNPKKLSEFNASLPFKLTASQKKVIREIMADLKQNRPMNRLLQGEVGSGKTVVAAAAIYQIYLNHLSSVLMAPTEILAQQHYATLSQILSPLGVKISLLTSATKKANLKVDLIVGTHALIYQKTKLPKIGLVVIDEQQRFGVVQRAGLGQITSHLLTMTATPIPRTVFLTIFGDLDFSHLNQLPQGKSKISTWVVPDLKRPAAYKWIKSQIISHQSQAFVVCPLIEESASETLQSVKAVTSEFEKLKTKVFPELKLGLLHGRLKSKQKQAVLGKFKKGQIDILVTTPVVEVGIDIPKASIMVIEDAQRFGLAQLHQLRGRIGRSGQKAYCLLFSQFRKGKPYERLKAMEKINIGLQLAELDLKFRGPGEIYGTQQHGFFDLKVAHFTDSELIDKAGQAASMIISRLNNFPLLKERLKKYTINTIKAS